ncbi:MAG: 2-vinyl bacteriochlorophyllide hydratase [Polynucleobacter sp.]|jgi:3-vinyl bacteriochlorophyllide hydratase|nr:2-vinyl bacteriochlorophyllide hydratase [Polynucleobacter sp.]
MSKPYQPLYTPEQRKRRDLSVWTWIQGVLAPIQFLVFLVSITLVIRYLVTGEDYQLATVSILIKTFFLLLIMLTGCIWEKVVFGKYLFADAFFWEDVVSMGVIFLHLAYVYALLQDALSPQSLMFLALVAYVTYFINAAQFLLKLRAARKDHARQAVNFQEQAISNQTSLQERLVS